MRERIVADDPARSVVEVVARGMGARAATPNGLVFDVGWRPRRRSSQGVLLAMLALLVVQLGITRAPGAVHLGGVPIDPGPAPLHGAGRGSEVVVDDGATAADEQAVRWALDRFREADLRLPERVRVSFHDDQSACNGAAGGFTMEGPVSRILVCVQGRATRELMVKRTLLHEFAHAWDRASLTDQVRSTFQAFRGAVGWLGDAGVAYEDLAGEHAAETITWGLVDEPLLLGTAADPWGWQELRDGFRILTGSEAPHGYVWSWFAVSPSHRTHARTPGQLRVVERAWEAADLAGDAAAGRRVVIRFRRNSASCNGAPTRSELVDGHLQVQVCPASPALLVTHLQKILRTTEEGAAAGLPRDCHTTIAYSSRRSSWWRDAGTVLEVNHTRCPFAT